MMQTIGHSGLRIPFVKASGCGNTFLIVESGNDAERAAELTKRMCDPHTGVGADGVEWISASASSDADVDARLINADGSEAEISGNGTRCVAAYWLSRNASAAAGRAGNGGSSVRVRTGAGVKNCMLTSRADSTLEFQFEMNMGEPMTYPEFELFFKSRTVKGTIVTTGNPHFVVFVNDFNFMWQKMGEEIQREKCFPNGTNVEFVQVLGDSEIACRFFERGVGETKSSGTGSCASAVAAIVSRAVKSPVRVEAQGGSQEVRWEKDVFLRGPAQIICEGEFFDF
ncbi:MAG: diaminopimelate epimerase [Acidobacteriaceae bacterium]|nr:diaminopimelate epimerase [Acidobacteriaceae bacterium]